MTVRFRPSPTTPARLPCTDPHHAAIPAKYRALIAMAAGAACARPGGAEAAAGDARAAGASAAEIAEAVRLGRSVGAATMRRRHALPVAVADCRACTVLWMVALILGALLLAHGAPPSRADVCGDGAAIPASGCPDPGNPVAGPPAPGLGKPPWLGAIEQRDPQFGDSYLAMRERILRDGAIPAKYKLLMAMVTDAIAAHPDGVKTLAGNARAAGASEPEVTEAVEVGYLFGGTAALVMGANAFGG
ncbi:carboxymuconolactone decarboxylase family protein [Mycobacterium sp. E3247]|uniref:carboxymuconolactone decarboxylase family protein n=1 Tax=Mycobacterium sp. E3247 TaxID=1856864 RepID=UPI0009ED2616|nr:carboxymuconolactone decarboxylase family protein [Mycobacterium sp. E3247]